MDTGDRWVLNFGPQHPATHTTLRVVMELDGERIARITPHIGYLHSGFEKLGEVLDYNQYVTIVSRMNYLSPIANDICWHHAVEKLFGITITPRCTVVRTIMAELARIQDHLLCVGAAGLDLNAITGFLYCFNLREKIYDICDFISGQHFHPDWTRVSSARCRICLTEETFKRMIKNFIHKELPEGSERGRGPAQNRDRIFWMAPGHRRHDAQRKRSTSVCRGRWPAPAASSATSARTSRISATPTTGTARAPRP